MEHENKRVERVRAGLKARIFYLFCIAGILSLSSCGGKFFPPPCKTNCNTTSSGNYIYVANSSTAVSSVAGFTITSASAVNALTNSPYTIGLPPNALAITPKNTFLYVGSLSGGIYAYTVDANGTISVANSGSPVATGVSPIAMKVDPTGQWLIAADLSPAAYVFSINTSTGALTTQGNALALDTGTTSNLYITPNGQFVFISLGTGGVDILTFNATSGVISKSQILRPTASANADFGLSSDPNSKYLFVTETGINSLRVFSINTTGSSILTELSTSPVSTGLGPSQVLVTKDGSYVYVTNRTDGTISGFTLAANGSLTALSGSPYTTGSAPVDIAEDNTKTYISVACVGGNPDMQVFKIDTTTPGKLDAFASKTTGTDPTLASAIVNTN
jgi:6-phosphogluconolactonase